MHRQTDQNVPFQGSALKRRFDERMYQQTMAQQAPIEVLPTSQENVDNYIDSNYDLDDYIGVETETTFNEPYTRPEYRQSDLSRGGIYDDNDDLRHRQTTSIHRNVSGTNPRQVPYSNLEDRRKWMSAAKIDPQLDEHATKIYQFMLQDNTLNGETSDSEQLLRDALRDMPQSLAVKKRIKRKFKEVSSRSSEQVSLGCFKVLQYRLAMRWSQVKGNFKDFLYTFELWYGPLKKIEGNFGSGVSSYFKFLRWLFLINVFMMVFSLCFIAVPQIIHDSNNGTLSNPIKFDPIDLIKGTGYFNSTMLYYGYYSPAKDLPYSIPIAYFFTNVCVYIVVFLILSFSMAKSYRKSFIETRGGLQNVFAHKIFCGWDYSIATTKAATLKSRSILNEIQEFLHDIKSNTSEIKFSDKCRTYIIQATAHVFSISGALACGYLMYYLLERENTLIPAIVINAVMVFVPIIYRLLASYEDYKSPKTSLFVTLARTVFLELVVVGVLLYYWLKEARQLAGLDESTAEERNTRELSSCWENELGQEIYRLILFDFFFSTLFMAVVDIAWYATHKVTKKVDAPEFDIARNTLSVIYNQTLFWVGFYFSPLLGVMVVVKLFLTWYIRSYILLQCCEAPKKAWRAAQTESWFLIITFLWSLILLFVHGYHIVMIGSSTDCGPFRNVLKEHLDIDSDSKILAIVLFILKPGFVSVILIGMLMGVYYLRAIAIAQADMVTFLQNRLVLASKDKEFLIENINIVSKGKYKFNKPQERDHLTNPEKVAPRFITTQVEGDELQGIPRPHSGSSVDDLLLRYDNVDIFDGGQHTPQDGQRY